MEIFEHTTELKTEVSERLLTAVKNMEFARRYTMSLLEDLETEEWYWTPDSSVSNQSSGDDNYVTHIAWQAGHIAMAQYGLTLFQQRGRDRDIDKGLMASSFRKLFMRGTRPETSREKYPEPEEIFEVLDKVKNQMLIEVPGFDGEQLDEPLGPPHAAYATRYGALLFASNHEMIHAGQIGMLRRLMGKQPLR